MDFSFVFSKYIVYFFEGAKWTIILSAISVFFGVIFGFLITVMKISNIKILKFIASAYIEIIRGTPMLLQIFIVYYGIDRFIDVTAIEASIIALSINSAAYVAELIRAGIEAVDKGQTEAARSLGMSSWMTLRLIIIPQAIKNILPAIGNEFVAVIKESSMASTLGVAELMYGAKVIGARNYSYLEPLIVSAVFYFILTFTIGRIIKYFERRLKVSDTN